MWGSEYLMRFLPVFLDLKTGPVLRSRNTGKKRIRYPLPQLRG